MFAGLSEAIGECVVVIDCDLQHPPGRKLWRCIICGRKVMKLLKV